MNMHHQKFATTTKSTTFDIRELSAMHMIHQMWTDICTGYDVTGMGGSLRGREGVNLRGEGWDELGIGEICVHVQLSSYTT